MTCNVQPLGNRLTSTTRSPSRSNSLGLFSLLPDTLITHILESLLSTFTPHDATKALLSLSETSVYTRAFALDDDLWRRLTFVQHSISRISHTPFKSSWYTHFLNLSGHPHNPHTQSTPVYSDILFHKHRLLTHPILQSWTSTHNIPRISASALSINDFRHRFEIPSKPLILTDIVNKWPAATWSLDALALSHPQTIFHAGGYSFSLPDYAAYARNMHAKDDQPLYIFDRDFASKAPDLAQAYTPPPYFQPDLFESLASNRPDHRWLIIGPARSGSTFHKDPNHTSAWNAVLQGAKKWVLFPPHSTPPGVQASEDGADVRTAVSVTEWFANFYDPRVLREKGAVEGVVREGEVMFIPAGWWHCVMNLELSVAVTQNFASEALFGDVLNWIQRRVGDVSGCRDEKQRRFVCENFERLAGEKFGILKGRANAEGLQQVRAVKKRKLWEGLRSDDGFSFGF